MGVDTRKVTVEAWVLGDLLMAATCGAYCPWDAVSDAFREAREALLKQDGAQHG
jgi:polyferredoxin